MGAFNLLHTETPCPICGRALKRAIQFRYGNVWQHDYVLGDCLHWGGNDVGEPGLAEVVVYGIAEDDCPDCDPRVGDEYEILVLQDLLSSIAIGREGPHPTTDDELYEIRRR